MEVQCTLEKQKGAVLLLVALLTVVLFLAVALAIDTVRLGSAHQKQSRTAELAALGALEAYVSTEKVTGDTELQYYTKRLANAQQRAEEIAGFSMNYLTAGMSYSKQLDSGNLGDGTAGSITAGTWWFSEPSKGCDGADSHRTDVSAGTERNENNCPCNEEVDPWEWRGSCFLANDNELTASAFQVNLNSKAGNPVATVFARVRGGPESIAIRSRAWATVVPRHAAFLVDLSNSVVRETHDDGLNFLSGNNPYSYVGFNLQGAAACPADWDDIGPAPLSVSPPDGDEIEPVAARLTWQGFTDVNPDFPPMETGRPPDTLSDANRYRAATKRYKSDYECKIINMTHPDGTAKSDVIHLVEWNHVPREICSVDPGAGNCPSGKTSKYLGPEPLTSIMGGLHSAIEIMDEFAISGDTILLVGFDGTIYQERQIGPTRPGQNDYNTLRELTEIPLNDDATLEVRYHQRIERGLFPQGVAFTNLPQALLSSLDELNQLSNAEVADRFMAIFSDGMTNCAHYGGTNNPGDLSGRDFLSTNSQSFVDRGYGPCGCQQATDSGCGTPEMEHLKSVAEVRTLIEGSPLEVPDWYTPFVDRKLKVHSFVFGRYVQPHTILRKSSTADQCMSDAESRRAGNTPLVADDSIVLGTYDSNSETNPYMYPNHYLYHHVSKPTGGLFIPVRPPCDLDALATMPNLPTPAGIEADCQNGEFLANLNGLCGGLAQVGDVLTTLGDPTVDPNHKLFIDGRLICDPSCSSMRAQIKNAVQLMFEDNPFILVEHIEEDF